MFGQHMKWVVMKFFQVGDTEPFKRSIIVLLRFIDDLFGGWHGTYRQFKQFVTTFNDFGRTYGIIFDKEQFGDTVNYLDVLVSNTSGSLVTDLFVKPTDARRYLHHNSFHPGHTFDGIPFSQMRRAALICSNNYLRDLAIDEMKKCFLQCGYKEERLDMAITKVQQLKREDLLFNLRRVPNENAKEPLLCVLPHSVDNNVIKTFVNSLSADIDQLTGSDSIMYSFRRNCNVSSLLFNKYGFAQNRSVLSSQRCGVRNCGSCKLKLPDMSPLRVTPHFTLKPARDLNCKSECVIYAAICKLCRDFYFGKTINEDHTRMNGHRDKFCQDRFYKSALSMHLYTDHPNNVGITPDEGLSNFNVVLLESTNARDLRRRESFYIWSTEADVKHLNRYQVF